MKSLYVFGVGGLALALGCVLGACGVPLQVEIQDGKLSLHDTTLTVASAETGVFQPVVEGWVVDNFTMSGDPSSPSLSAKKGVDYEVQHFIDRDEDGQAEEHAPSHIYVIRMRHRSTDGTIALRVIPVAPTEAERNLDVLVDRYIDNLRGTHRGLVQLRGRLFKTHQERPLAVRIRGRETGTWSGEPAAGGMIDLADAHDLLMDPHTVSRRHAVVVAHAPFKVAAFRPGYRGAGLPALVLATYSNNSRDFDAQLPDFVGFLGRIGFDGRTGMTLRFPTESINAGAASAPAVPQSVVPQPVVPQGAKPAPESVVPATEAR